MNHLLSTTIGHVLRWLPPLRGRHRLQRWWLGRPRAPGRRLSRVPAGARIWCDLTIPYEAMVWLHREEWSDLIALGRLLRPGQTLVDVGANIGTWALQAATLVGAEGRVFALEPNPATVHKLAANVALNGFEPWVSVLPIAAGAANGTVSLVCAREHNNSHVGASGEGPSVVVSVRTLDDCLRDAGHVHGLKIDVEGQEHAVLAGANQLICRCHPWIVVEFNLDTAGVSRLGDWPVHQWLLSHGYAAEPLPSSGAHRITAEYRPRPCRYANLLYRGPGDEVQ